MNGKWRSNPHKYHTACLNPDIRVQVIAKYCYHIKCSKLSDFLKKICPSSSDTEGLQRRTCLLRPHLVDKPAQLAECLPDNCTITQAQRSSVFTAVRSRNKSTEEWTQRPTWEKDFVVLGKRAMAYLVLTWDILVVCVLICSQTFIDNFSGFCGRESINKNKGTSLPLSGTIGHIHTHTYINHSVHSYILTQLSLKGTQLQPQSQCYFHLTFNMYLVAVSNFIFCSLICLFVYDCSIHFKMLAAACGASRSMWSHFKYGAVSFYVQGFCHVFLYFCSWCLSTGTLIWISCGPGFSQMDKCPFQEADNLWSICTCQPPVSGAH